MWQEGGSREVPDGTGKAGSSPKRMIRGWSLEVGIMRCMENHLGAGKDGEVGFILGQKRPGPVGAERGVGVMWSRTRPRWEGVDPWGRPGHPRAHRVEQNAVLLVLLGVKHVVTVGRGRSEVSPGAITCSPYIPIDPASPFLAEANTHEARLVGSVRFHSPPLPAWLPTLAPLHDGSREGSGLVASPKEGRSARK